MNKERAIKFLEKAGIWVKDGKIAKAEVERAKELLSTTAAELSPMAQKFIDDAQAAINNSSLFDTDGKIQNAREEVVEKKFDKGPLPVSKITFDIINKDNDDENCGTIVILIMEDDKGKKPYLLIKSNDCVVTDSHGKSVKIDKIIGWAGAKTPVESAANWLYSGGEEEDDSDD